MSDTAKMGRKREGPPGRRPLVDDELADQLLDRAQAEGAGLLGPDGLLSQVTKAVLERALAEEMTGHLGYEKHDPAGRGSGNSRNGTTGKTVLTDAGAVDLAVPRDRAGTFEPQIVRKGQTRLEGFNDRIIALYARGMTTRDIRAHLREMYDVDVSPDLISRVTDGVLEELAEWQSRPLDRVYPVIFIDALMVKIRDGVVTNRPVYLAIGIDCEGAKQVLGLWVGPTTGESAKFWMSVLSELRSRGVADVCIVCCDGLTGLPEAITVTWPQAVVQLCVVHRDCKETTRWFWVPGLIGWYGHLRRGPRSARGAVRGVVAASERAAAAVGAGDRGAAAGSWRGAGGRAGGRGQRDHGPQGSVRTRGRCRAAARGASTTGGRRTAAGRGR